MRVPWSLALLLIGLSGAGLADETGFCRLPGGDPGASLSGGGFLAEVLAATPADSRTEPSGSRVLLDGVAVRGEIHSVRGPDRGSSDRLQTVQIVKDLAENDEIVRWHAQNGASSKTVVVELRGRDSQDVARYEGRECLPAAVSLSANPSGGPSILDAELSCRTFTRLQ